MMPLRASLIALVSLSSLCLGQDETPPAIEEPLDGPMVDVPAPEEQMRSRRRGVGFQLQTDFAHVFKTDIDGQDGSVATTLGGGRFSVSMPVSRQLRIGASAGAGFSAYDFNGDTGLVPGGATPWRTNRVGSLGLNAFYAPDEHWRLFAGVNLTSSGEEGADFEDTLTTGGNVALSYSFSEKLTVGVAISAQERLEDNPFVIAIPTLTWVLPVDPQERWRLEIGGTRVGASRAAGVGLVFEATETVTLSGVFGGFGLGGEFRLDADGPVPGGVGRDRSFPLLLGAQWSPNPGIEVSAFGGVALFRQLEVLDRDGIRVGRRDVHPSFTLGAGLTLRF